MGDGLGLAPKRHIVTSVNAFPRIVYKLVDGQEIDADVYLPRPRTNGDPTPLPIIINIHGGAFMLGSSEMVNRHQIRDCLDRSWIVVVDLLEGPMRDCRDLLEWIYRGGLQSAISSTTVVPYPMDFDHVFAFGTSSGGTLALGLGFDVPRPVAGILALYGPCHFSLDSWTRELPQILSTLPPMPDEFLNQVYLETPVPIRGGVPPEGRAPGPPDFRDPRQAFAWTAIARGRVLEAVCPAADRAWADPLRNITASFPPTFIVHGVEDEMVPIELSKGGRAILISD